MTEIGYATLGIIPSMRGFESALEKGTMRSMGAAGIKGGTAFGDHAGASAGKRFGGTFLKAAKFGAVGALGAAAFGAKFAKGAVDEASDLNESLNAIRVSYGRNAKAVKRLGTLSADALGLSNTAFNDLAVRFSAFTKTIATDGTKVPRVLDDLTTRAADFASVMNLEVGEAAQLFQSGLAGETEPLRKFGLDMSAAKVEAFALAKGIVESKDELDESAKVQARYRLLMEQTRKTQGDFANTSDSLANVQRRLNARWDDARAKIGTALLPMMEDLSGWVLDKGLPAFEDFSDWFQSDGMDSLKRFGNFLEDDVVPPLKTAAGWAEDFAGFLNDLPKEVKIGGLAGLAGLMGAAKLRGGSGALGGAGKALGLAKPVPVFVTNPGFGAGGGAGGKLGPGTALGAASRFGGTAAILSLFGYGLYKAGSIGDPGKLRMPAVTVEAAERFAELLGQIRTNPAGDIVQQAFRDAAAAIRKSKLEADMLSASLDWAARPREARITITETYARSGYQTRGGLQETTGGPNVPAVTVNVGEVRAHDYRDFMRQMQRRARGRNGGGVGF